MPEARTCPECGAAIPDGQPRGLCPRCALSGLLNPADDGSGALAQSSSNAAEVSSNSPLAPSHSHTEGEKLPSVQVQRNSCAGRQFGDYELLEEIARGGMGVVYKARQRSLDRLVAVKFLLFGPHASAEFIKRFRIEASAAAALQHPNIVAIHEVGVHEGEHFLVMDYVDGPNLAKLVREQPLPSKRAAKYLKTIAEAIHYAHEHGILHRDLKPSNVLIDSADQPRVTDFGLAKRFLVPASAGPASNEPAKAGPTNEAPAEAGTSDDSGITASGQVVGSPGYMPPEQAAGGSIRGRVSRRSDVYSLGAMLYHLLAHRPPFVGGSVAETLKQVEMQEPVSLRLLSPTVPVDLETICLKCLEKDPERRYQTAKELADELGRFLDDKPIHARPISRPEKLWRWCRREPKLTGMAAGIFLLLSVVALLTSLLYQRERKSRVQAEQESAHNLKALSDRIEKDRRKGEPTFLVSAEELNLLTQQHLIADSTEKRITLAACAHARSPDRMVMRYGEFVQEMQSRLRDQAQLAVLFDLRLYFSQADAEADLLNDPPELMRADPAVYVLARQKLMHLTPMVQEVCGGQTELRGALITRTNSGITVLSGLKGRSFAFSEVGSAIGWHLPMAVLVEAGLRSHDFKQITNFSTAHMFTAVRTAAIDAGVVMWDDLENLTKVGVRFRVLHELRCPSTPWVSTAQQDTNTVAALRTAILSVRNAQALARLSYDLTGFVPTRPENYDVLERQIEMARKFDEPPSN